MLEVTQLLIHPRTQSAWNTDGLNHTAAPPPQGQNVLASAPSPQGSNPCPQHGQVALYVGCVWLKRPWVLVLFTHRLLEAVNKSFDFPGSCFDQTECNGLEFSNPSLVEY